MREASVKNNLLILIAYQDGVACGYKAGFEQTARIFYSWIGGVHPKFRKLGIAKSLLEKQHSLIKEMDYECVRTHTENAYRNMLILNIKCGFDIIGVFKSDHYEKQTIMLEKFLAD